LQAQPNHALEPTAPSHAEHRGSARIVGRTNETKKYGSTRKKNKSHLAAPRIRVIRIRSASDSRERALSGGGALLSFSSGGRVNSRHRAVGEAKCRNRASGLSTYGGVRLARRGTRARRRVSGVSGNFSGTVDAAGLFTAGASIRSSVSVTRPSGSSRTACWGHQHRSRQSVASPSRRLAGRPHGHVRAWLIRTVGSLDRFAENGRSISRSRFGFHHRWRHHAPLGGSFDVVALSGVFVLEKLIRTDRPTRKWSRRDRLVRSCHRGRAAHLQRWADETKNPNHSTKNRLHLAAPRIGVVCITSGSESRECALSGGGAPLDALRSAVVTRGMSRR